MTWSMMVIVNFYTLLSNPLIDSQLSALQELKMIFPKVKLEEQMLQMYDIYI